MMVNRLIFEGPDDLHVVKNLLYNHIHGGNHLDNLFEFKVKGGIENLIQTLKEELKATDLGRLGVILDADTDLNRQWGRVTHVLDEQGCRDVPAAPVAAGTIVNTNDDKRIGIWVMPDNQSPGAVEDFIGKLIGEDDNLWPKAQADVIAIEEKDRRFKETYLSKAQVHTWLAWQEQPGTKMGGAFQKKYLDPEHPQARVFVAWIKQLLAD